MGGSASKAKAPAAPAPAPALSDGDKARLDIKRQRDRLSKAEARLRVEAGSLQEHAKEAVRRGDRETATRFLKLSKYKTKRREEVFGMLHNLEAMLSQLDMVQDMQGVARALAVGTAALKAMEQDISVEQAEAIMDDAQEALEVAAEIDAVFARELVPSGAPAGAAQAAIAAALAELQGEMAGGVQVGAGTPHAGTPSLPEVPRGAIVGGRARAGSASLAVPGPVAGGRMAVAS